MAGGEIRTVALRVREARLALQLAEWQIGHARDAATRAQCRRLADLLRLLLDGAESDRRRAHREQQARYAAAHPERIRETRRAATRRHRERKRQEQQQQQQREDAA